MPKKILLVEDQALIAMNEAQMIQKHGYEVLTAYNGEKAIETVDSDLEISLILMDIDLGKGIDGTEAAKRILGERDVPIVFLTSHSEKEYVDTVKEITNYGYLLKNSNEFVFIESIKMAFNLFETNQNLKQENEKRKKIEDALREEEAELSAIYEYTPVLMIILDSELRVRKANALATEFAGSPAEELLGQRVGEALRCIHHLDDPQGCGFGPYCGQCKVRQTVRASFEGENFKKMEATLPFSRNGTEKELTFLLSTSYLEIKDEPLVIVSIEDITEIKSLTKQLGESEERFRTVFSFSPDAMVLANRETGIIIEANQAAAELFETSLNELIGMHQKDLHPMEEQARAKTTFKYKPDKAEQRAPPVEIEIKNRKNIKKIAEIRGRIVIINDEVYVLGNFRDITERKKAQEALKRSEEKYRLLFNNSNDAIFVHEMGEDNLPGRIIDVNEQATRLFGYSRAELLNMTVKDLVPEKHAASMYVHVQELMERKHLTFETEGIRRDGHVISLEVSAHLYTEGNKKSVVSSFRDITERQLATQKLQNNLEFQKMVSEISSQFVKTTEVSFNTDVNKMLEAFGRHFKTDRSYLFQYSRDHKTMTNTNEWCAEGVTAQMENLQNLPVDSFPWVAERMLSGKFVHVSDVKAIPADAASEKKDFMRQNIQSLIGVPVASVDRTWGFIGFDSVKEKRTWNDGEIHNLKIQANTIAELLLKQEILKKKSKNNSL